METQRITEIFDKIFETDALIIKGAVAKELSRCNEDLTSIRVPFLPADYVEFLQIANGVSWNGFEFYGTYQVTEKRTGYCLRDIVNVNNEWHKRKLGLDSRIVLGTFDDDLYLYDPESKRYQTVDNLTLTPIDFFDSFEELFVCSIMPYLDEDWIDESRVFHCITPVWDDEALNGNDGE